MPPLAWCLGHGKSPGIFISFVISNQKSTKPQVPKQTSLMVVLVLKMILQIPLVCFLDGPSIREVTPRVQAPLSLLLKVSDPTRLAHFRANWHNWFSQLSL